MFKVGDDVMIHVIDIPYGTGTVMELLDNEIYKVVLHDGLRCFLFFAGQMRLMKDPLK